MSFLLRVFSLTCITLVNGSLTENEKQANTFLLAAASQLLHLSDNPTMGDWVSFAHFIVDYEGRKYFQPDFKHALIHVCQTTKDVPQSGVCRVIFGFKKGEKKEDLEADEVRAYAFLLLLGTEALPYGDAIYTISQVMKEPRVISGQQLGTLPVNVVFEACAQLETARKNKMQKIIHLMTKFVNAEAIPKFVDREHIAEAACNTILRNKDHNGGDSQQTEIVVLE